jgi:hypothetical protein
VTLQVLRLSIGVVYWHRSLVHQAGDRTLGFNLHMIVSEDSQTHFWLAILKLLFWIMPWL